MDTSTMSPCLIEDNAGYLHLCLMGEGPQALVYSAINATHDDEAIAWLLVDYEKIDWSEAEAVPANELTNGSVVVWGEAQGWALGNAGTAAKKVAEAFGIDVDE